MGFKQLALEFVDVVKLTIHARFARSTGRPRRE